MAEAFAFEDPLVSALVDAEKAGGEYRAAALEQPTDFVGLGGELSVVRGDFERVDAAALERVQNADGMDARKARNVCLGFLGVYLEQVAEFVFGKFADPFGVVRFAAPGRSVGAQVGLVLEIGVVGASPGGDAFGFASAGRVVIGCDEFSVVGHHDALGFADGFVCKFGGALDALVDLVAGVGVDIEPLCGAAAVVLVGVGACGDGLRLERFELGFVELADFVGNDASQVIFHVDDVDGVYLVPVGGDGEFSLVAGFIEPRLVGRDGDAAIGFLEGAAVYCLLALSLGLDFEFTLGGRDVQLFVLVADEDAWDSDEYAHLERPVQVAGNLLRDDGLLGYTMCFDGGVVRTAGRTGWGRKRECRQ